MDKKSKWSDMTLASHHVGRPSSVYIFPLTYIHIFLHIVLSPAIIFPTSFYFSGRFRRLKNKCILLSENSFSCKRNVAPKTRLHQRIFKC